MENKKSPKGLEEMVIATDFINSIDFETVYKIIKNNINRQLEEDKIEFKEVRFLRSELTDNGNGWSTVKSYFKVIN